MKEFKLNKSQKKQKKEKIDNPEHFSDVHNINNDAKIPDDLSKMKRQQRSHFPSHIWPVPNEKKKGPKV